MDLNLCSLRSVGMNRFEYLGNKNVTLLHNKLLSSYQCQTNLSICDLINHQNIFSNVKDTGFGVRIQLPLIFKELNVIVVQVFS